MTTAPCAQGKPNREQIERELALIAVLRALIRESEGPDFRPPTTVPDRLLDQWNQSAASADGDRLADSAISGKRVGHFIG